MKYFSLIFLSACLASAADFTTGQAARMVIGQPTFTAQATGTPSAAQMGAVGGIALSGNTLFAVDSNRVQATPIQHRILVYNNISNFVQPPTADIQQGGRCPVCSSGAITTNSNQTVLNKQADVVIGEPDFATVTSTNDVGLSASGFRTPTAVATDGRILAVADTDNNRVMIWKSIPQANGVPADLVLGQVDFKTVRFPTVDSRSFRGPQGVWIQGTRLFVADTQNHRIMVWNSIPTSNNQPADYVLGQPNFNTAPSSNIVTANQDAKANNLLNPVSVTSDGQRLYVSDLGYNRVLIWNSIPTQTQQPADVAIGQPDLVSSISNNSTSTSTLCASNGTDSTTNTATYPTRCAATLSIPRYALSDGKRLFIADGGNDRILIYNTIPTKNGQRADVILGQTDEFVDVVTDSTDTFRPDANITRSSTDTIRTPISLAWDGYNLYASDPYDRRILVYSPGDISLTPSSLTNAFSRTVYAVGTVDLSGTITAANTVTITVQGTGYTYTILKADTLASVADGLVARINVSPGDPNVFAISNPGFNEVVLSAKKGGETGNAITLAVSTSSGATITATASGATLSRGQSAQKVAPGSLVTIYGTNLTDRTVIGFPNANGYYPTDLGGVTVYFDGIKAPLLSVAPSQINTQLPYEVQDSNGVSAYAVIHYLDGTVANTTAVNVPVVLQNPGILAADGTDPRPVIAFHTNNNATAVVDIGGTVKAGDTATITIDGTAYTYTILSSDTLSTVRDAFIVLINADNNLRVSATAAGQYNRIILTAKVPGPNGEGILISVTSSTSSSIALTALQSQTCCSSTAGLPVDQNNPAIPGETISIYATGVGIVQPDAADAAAVTGLIYSGPKQNSPTSPVDDAQVGGKTANVLNAGLLPGMLGVYEVQLQLSTDLPDNMNTQMFIAQNVFTSNIVTIPVMAPPAQ